MSWHNRHPNLRPEDWDLLDFDQQQNEVFTITINGQSEDNSSPDTEHSVTPQTSRKVVEGEADLGQWVDKVIVAVTIRYFAYKFRSLIFNGNRMPLHISQAIMAQQSI